MADSNDSSINLVAGANADVRVTELLRAASPAFVYARDDATSSGLTWGYRGGRWGGNSVSAGTQAIGASTTTYMVVALSNGAVSFSTSTTNWDDDTTYVRAYKIVSGGSGVTSYEDHRAGPGGTMFGAGSSGGGGVPTVVTVSGTTRNMAASDASTYMRFTNAGTKTLTVQDNADEALAANSEYHGRNVGAGDLTIVEDTSVTINVPAGGSLVIPQGGTFTLKRVATDEFDLFGVTLP